MSETYPRKNHCETLFAGHTPSSVGIGCKGTTKFADVQILSRKSFRSFKSFNGKSCLVDAALLFRVSVWCGSALRLFLWRYW